MNNVKKILANGYLPLTPVLLWNILLVDYLPMELRPEFFNLDIPSFILWGENIFRTLIFMFPLFFVLDVKGEVGGRGLIIYMVGVLIYFMSWGALILWPDSAWSNSVLGFTAPAYTPLIWLAGLAFMTKGYYFNLSYKKWHYLIPMFFFFVFHLSHALYVYFRSSI